MNLITKKTNELSKNEITQISDLFEAIFNKQMSNKDFINKFLQNIKSYSYHSLLINENEEIVGCYSAIPYEYNYFGKKVLFGLSVDTMIKEEYRGSPFTLKKLANNVYEEMKKDGISFVFGFPNNNVYLVRKKILKWKDIGELKYYILPIKIGAIKSKLKALNLLSKIYANSINNLVNSDFSTEKATYEIEKSNLNLFRYDDTYSLIEFSDSYMSYKIYNEDGVKTAYLIDVYPLSKNNIEIAVKRIYEKEVGYIDMILYVGNLDFKPKNLIEVPKRYEPKTVHMSGIILDEAKVDERVFNINNWNVNLSNYDVR
jgi:hypothetical protein